MALLLVIGILMSLTCLLLLNLSTTLRIRVKEAIIRAKVKEVQEVACLKIPLSLTISLELLVEPKLLIPIVLNKICQQITLLLREGQFHLLISHSRLIKCLSTTP
jgi:hypothetical protein